MINFFRKIRRKFADNNQFLKYSRYAIGEIVLVMIGILLALQVNTWNEDRKVRGNTKDYQIRLIRDIENDTIKIHNELKTRTTTINHIKKYFKFYESEKFSLEVLMDSATSVQFDLLRYFPVNYTFKDMQSSGNLNLLSIKQQQVLFELSHLQSMAQLVAEKHMDEFFHESEEKNKFLGRHDHRAKTNFFEKVGLKKDSENIAQGLLHMNNMFHVLMIYHTAQNKIGKNIIQKSKETIEALRSS